jgi:hypothetical protein
MYEISTALSTIQIVKNLTKAIIDSKVSSALREQAIESQFAIIDLQNTIMNMQTHNQTLLQEKTELKQQLVNIENWETEKSKYYLEQPEPGIFVYAFDFEVEMTEPEHWLCANCYQNKQKSILQRTGSDSRGLIFLCFRCQNSIRTMTGPGEKPPSPPPV